MAAVREFGLKGGVIGTGDDAGYLYGSLYGFGITRELELHEEAGFHPLEVIRHATSDGAKIVGLADKLGRIREGFIADLLVVNGNPLENLRVLNPYGIDVMTYDGKIVEQLLRLRAAGRSAREARSWRRHRVDDQGRHSVQRADADEGSEGHGDEGKGTKEVGVVRRVRQVRPVRRVRGACCAGQLFWRVPKPKKLTRVSSFHGPVVPVVTGRTCRTTPYRFSVRTELYPYGAFSRPGDLLAGVLICLMSLD